MTSENLEKPTKKKQHGSKVNYLQILLDEYISALFEKIFG